MKFASWSHQENQWTTFYALQLWMPLLPMQVPLLRRCSSWNWPRESWSVGSQTFRRLPSTTIFHLIGPSTAHVELDTLSTCLFTFRLPETICILAADFFAFYFGDRTIIFLEVTHILCISWNICCRGPIRNWNINSEIDLQSFWLFPDEV